MKVKTGRKYIVTRDIYKGVKKMDRQSFDNFCNDLYREGWKDGRESVPGIDVKEVMETIKTVKGIGDTRLQKIAEAIDVEFGGMENGNEEHAK